MDILKEELKRSFYFLWNHTNINEEEQGYGLVLDNNINKKMASIASGGFALAGIVIGIENEFISYDEGLKRSKIILKNAMNNISHHKGIMYHFLDFNTSQRYNKTEYSTIDTAIFICGAISVDSYFEDEEIHNMFNIIYNRVDFKYYTFLFKDKLTFRMAYNPDKDGAYRFGNDTHTPWIYQWDMYAEQLMLYFLAAGSNFIAKEEALQLYNGFDRIYGQYNNNKFINSPGGALFTHQFSHAFIDFAKYKDNKIDWFKNSKIACLNNREWCMNNNDKFPLFNKFVWGLSASDTKNGYKSSGTPPFGFESLLETDGAISPYSICGSVIFIPNIAEESLNYIYENYQSTFGEYGFKDAFSLEKNQLWISEKYIGIDKGISMIMIDNYLNGTIHRYFMKHEIIKKAIKVLNFNKLI